MRGDRLVKSHLRERYLVTMVDGEAFEGLLHEADARHIVLVSSESISPQGDRLKVDGSLWLPRERIAYMQLPKG